VHFCFPPLEFSCAVHVICEFFAPGALRRTLSLQSAAPFRQPLNHWFALSVEIDVNAVGRVEEPP